VEDLLGHQQGEGNLKIIWIKNRTHLW
jgi:hypothetical protein